MSEHDKHYAAYLDEIAQQVHREFVRQIKEQHAEAEEFTDEYGRWRIRFKPLKKT